MVLSYSGAVSLTRGSLEENLGPLCEAGGGLEEERRMSRSWNVGNILLCEIFFIKDVKLGGGNRSKERWSESVVGRLISRAGCREATRNREC